MKNKIIAITPFVSLICFLLTWLVENHFWYGTLWFLLNLFIPIIVYINPRSLFKSTYPIILCLTFIVMGIFKLWEYAWIALILIPILDMFFKKQFLIVRSINLIILITYLVLGFNFKIWHPGWIIFFLIPINRILFKDLDEKIQNHKIKNNKYVFYHKDENEDIS